MTTGFPAPRPIWWPWILAGLLLTTYFVTPPREVFDQSLDKSNYATYAHFFAQKAQWGADVVPMTGPYGFVLYGHTYSGEVFWSRFFGDLLLKAAVGVLLLKLFNHAGRGSARWIWLLGSVFLVPTVDDLFHDYAILLAGLCLISDFNAERRRFTWLPTVLLGFLALFKGTHLVTTLLVLGFVVILALVERNRRRLVSILTGYLAALAGFWLLAHQDLRHLPAYLRNTVDLTTGYNAAMGLDETPLTFAAGLTVAAGLLLLLVAMAWNSRSQPRRQIAVFLIGAFGFIKWKHGFLRADGHVAIFFTAAAVLALTAHLIARSELVSASTTSEPAAPRRLTLALLTAVVGLGTLGGAEFWLLRVGAIATDVPERLAGNLRYLTGPNRLRQQLDAKLAETREQQRLPKVRNEIGAEPVDFFGFQQGILLLNDLNYRPRPMGGGAFNVVTPRLQQMNAAAIADPRRSPKWELLKLQTIDERLPAADDSLTLRALLDLYAPVLLERDYILFGRRASSASNSAVLLQTVEVRSGETIRVPDVDQHHFLLFEVEAPLTTAGRLRSFFYRPPTLTLKVFTDRHPTGRPFALKPSLLKNPAILSPLLLSNRDLLKILAAEPGDRVHRIQIDASPGFDVRGLKVRFFRSARPPALTKIEAEALQSTELHPLYNREPVSVVSEQTGIHELNKEPVQIVHAPGSITWDLQAGDQQISFSYGLMPQAYITGRSDGVEFNVEVLWPPSDGRVLFKHMIRPRTVPEDRGLHHATIALPPFEPGAQLRIRTHPGPDNDGAFDQSFVTRVHIAKGPLAPAQFNGLGVVTADGLLPHRAVAGIEGRPVYLIHAPDEVALPIPEAARTFVAEIGLLPGAYSNGGASDGVEFTVYTQQPGEQRKKVWSRLVEPCAKPTDRGPLEISIPLPHLSRGSTLVVATGVGPKDNRSWDQSYVANVRFER